MCRVKLIDQKRHKKESMQLLSVTVPIEKIFRAAVLRWYGHVLQRKESNILKETLSFEVTRRRKRGRPKVFWKKQAESLIMISWIKNIGLRKEDALSWKKLLLGFKTVKGSQVNLAPSIDTYNVV